MKKTITVGFCAGSTMLVAFYFLTQMIESSARNPIGKTKEMSRDQFSGPVGFGVVNKELRREIPWRDIGVKFQSNVGQLSLKVESPETCHLGDMDLIKKDLNNSNRRQLIVSLESILPDESFKGSSFILNENAPSKIKFQLPTANHPMQLGLFVCKDSDNSRRCNDKSDSDMNKDVVDGLLARDGVKKEDRRTPDRIYYFQYLYWDQEQLHVFQNSPVHDEIFQNVEDKLMQLFPGMPIDREKNVFRRAKELTQKMSSLAAVFENGDLKVFLPKKSAKPCSSFALAPTR